MSSPYSILGLQVGADASLARDAFRSIAKTCHPDINPDPKAREVFVKAEAAYRAITGASASSDKVRHKPSRASRMVEIDLPVSIWSAAKGGQVKGTCALGQAIVKVPAGVRDGDRIIAKIGASDVACVVRIDDEDDFHAQGSDIITFLRISPNQAKFGGFAEIETPSGRLRIKVPENTPDGARLRVENRGLPSAKNRPAGHLFLDVEIVETVADRAVMALDRILNAAKRPRTGGKIQMPGFGKSK